MSNTPHARGAPPAVGKRAFRRRLLPAVLLVAIAVAVGWLAWARWKAGAADPERLWEQAGQASTSGQWAEAERALSRLAELRPATVRERLLRAHVARQRGRPEAALAALDGVADSDPDAARIWSARGLIEFERNRGRAAETALIRAVALNPRLTQPRRGLIDLYTIEGRRGELEAQFRALAELQPLDFDDLYQWTTGRRQDVGPADLAAKLEPMLATDPADRSARLALADNLRRLGRLDQAETTLAPLAADDPEARAAIVRIVLDRGQLERALSLLAAGPADDPALEELRGRLALSHGEVAAVSHYRTALAASPLDRDALFGLGQALRLAGKPDAAQPYLAAARARDHLDALVQNARSRARRDDPRVLREIGDACRALERLHEARAWYRLALARDPLALDLQKTLFELDAAIKNDRQNRGEPR